METYLSVYPVVEGLTPRHTYGLPLEVGKSVMILSSEGKSIQMTRNAKYFVKTLKDTDILRGTLTKKDIDPLTATTSFTVTTDDGKTISWTAKGPDSEYFFIIQIGMGKGGSRRRLQKTKKRRALRKSKSSGRKH